MAELQITADDFSLTSSYQCITVLAESTGEVTNRYTTASTTKTKNVEFAFELPDGATIKSATVNATLGTGAYSIFTCTINGVDCKYGETVSIPVEIEDGATSVTVPFVYKCHPLLHDHGVVETTNHSSSLTYKNVYLLIEYEASTGSVVYLAVGGALAPYQIFRAEGGVLVQYNLYQAQDGALVQY